MNIAMILDMDAKSVFIQKEEVSGDYAIIYNTLNKDTSNSELEAVQHIYKQLRGADAPDDETARGISDKLFFSDKRYDLGEVGRYKINRRLGLNFPIEKKVLTKDDIIAIIKTLVLLTNGNSEVDDIDHLGNRRIRSVGDVLSEGDIVAVKVIEIDGNGKMRLSRKAAHRDQPGITEQEKLDALAAMLKRKLSLPSIAVFSAGDGLDHYRRLLAGAADHQHPAVGQTGALGEDALRAGQPVALADDRRNRDVGPVERPFDAATSRPAAQVGRADARGAVRGGRAQARVRAPAGRRGVSAGGVAGPRRPVDGRHAQRSRRLGRPRG